MKKTPQIGVSAARNQGTRGFTLLEMLISLLVLAVVSGAVFAQINRMQQRSNSEAIKVDISQQAREFLDETVRDLHMAGYPNASMYSNPAAYPSKVAVGLVSVSPTQILLEGDVNNDGNVYSVKIWYVAADPNDPNCPCIRRSAVPKIDADSFSQPTTPNYTETQYVLPPGTGTGQSGEDLFTYYDQIGNPVVIASGVDIRTPGGVNTPSGQTLISSIKTVKINLSLLGAHDPETNSTITRTSMSATARLN